MKGSKLGFSTYEYIKNTVLLTRDIISVGILECAVKTCLSAVIGRDAKPISLNVSSNNAIKVRLL